MRKRTTDAQPELETPLLKPLYLSTEMQLPSLGMVGVVCLTTGTLAANPRVMERKAGIAVENFMIRRLMLMNWRNEDQGRNGWGQLL